ncbi:MAG: hypothetical protein RLZZ214_166 [Verrucomicrobiota bacterium]
MNFIPQKTPGNRGFALVVTLSLMILLTVIAVGLLSLSSISLRTSASGEASARAYGNARLAVLLAVGELQKEAGDDRRITADASILSASSPQPHLTGVWSSWSLNAAAQPDQTTPESVYEEKKTKLFKSWLVSSPNPAALRSRDWAATQPPANDPKWIPLFSLKRNGFDLTAQAVPMPLGGMAWAVSQENTKAKINVAGPEAETAVNLALQVQRRPSLALSSTLKQPVKEWNQRANRVLSLSQATLDGELTTADPTATLQSGASYTVHAQGLLTDVVKGGLKTDLSLGFELSDAEFAKAAWDGVPNPFRTPKKDAGFTSPSSFENQQALFRPLAKAENPIVSSKTDYGVASLSFRFYAAAVPTFDHLRSFYRIPHHLYGGSLPVVAERGPDHVAAVTPPAASKTYLAPNNPPPGDESKLSIRPVLNRMIYLLSSNLDSENQVQLLITPVISLWNPYNTRLEIEGAVAYPWMDLPFQLIWERKSPGQPVVTEPIGMADAMGKQFESKGQSRQVDPYFFCEMTANGDGDTSQPIRFEPGEVRVFYPASPVPVDFKRLGSNAQRTLRLRPAEDIGGVNKRGGFQVSMQQADGLAKHGLAKYQVKKTDEIRIALKDISAVGQGRGQYHYFVSLEDAARIKDPADSTRGQVITDVQILRLVSAENTVASPWRTFDELKTGAPVPFGVIETFHRTANTSVGGQAVADLIYTTNPRNPSINHQLANTNPSDPFTVAPHFQSTLRTTPSFDDAIQTSFDGRKSYWGPSHSSSGKSELPFFEVPRHPLLSLAAFQHADLSSSTFAPANQFGNSWASAYLSREKTGFLKPGASQLPEVPIYDVCYLTNESLWDGYFFSGAAPRLQPAGGGKPGAAWKQSIASEERSLKDVVTDFVASPLEKPLGNSRMRLSKSGVTDEKLVERLLDPAGCTRIAANLTVDGAFNINSTDVDAWTAQLSALRGETFQVEGGSPPAAALTAFPRFRNPLGITNDNWNGFRALSDPQVRTLAENLVKEIRQRGPFLSLAEFVNRRVEDSEFGKSGAIQAAIEAGQLNEQAKQTPFSVNKYPDDSQNNIINDTGVGIPGYLTQADVLQPLAPVITCRSDTFTVRGYGEAKDAGGKVTARAWCEAVVQRMPDFVDPTNAADTAITSLSPINQTFGRRFEVISFRRVSNAELN